MHAIILAGGSGRRMRPLTNKCQKAILHFHSRPIIEQVVKGLLNSRIEIVYIFTGFRADDVSRTLQASFPLQLEDRRIVIRDVPQARGTWSRLAEGVRATGQVSDCCVCGIDALVPRNDLCDFLERAEENQADLCLLISPRLGIAPTHRRVEIAGRKVLRYARSEEFVQTPARLSLFPPEICVETGIRYFPRQYLSRLIDLLPAGEHYLPKYLGRVATERKLFAHRFAQDWRHFAIPKDLEQPRLNLVGADD